jgi:NAD(P)-dependent dehydrogenase (short-subunit alcohol dehydrogenase family)
MEHSMNAPMMRLETNPQPQLSGRVAIVTGSTSGISLGITRAAYVAAKHGLVGLTKAVALETGEHGITANLSRSWHRTRPPRSPARTSRPMGADPPNKDAPPSASRARRPSPGSFRSGAAQHHAERASFREEAGISAPGACRAPSGSWPAPGRPEQPRRSA